MNLQLQLIKQRSWRRLRRRGAFTLLEIMVAIALFAMVMMAIYSSWHAILRGSKVGIDAAAEAQRMRVALRAIKEALSSAELYTANISYYSFFADTSGEFAALSFVARLPASFPGSGLFGNQIVRRVSFNVERGPDGRNQFVLRQVPLLEPPDSTAKPYMIMLTPEVSLFAVEFWNTNTFEWVPEWPFTNQLPRMVRVALNFSPPGRGHAQDVAIETAYVSSVAIPRELQIPPARRGIGTQPGRLPGQQPLPTTNPRLQPGGPGGAGVIPPSRPIR